MILVRWALLFVCLFTLWFSSFSGDASALCPEYVEGFHNGIHSIIGQRGLDCSGAIHLAARRGGLPVIRTTARRMAMGLDGWTSVVVDGLLADGEELDLIWWSRTNRPDRPNGHVGTCHVGHSSGLLEIVHASSKQKRVIEQPCTGALQTDVSMVRRLTIGDRK